MVVVKRYNGTQSSKMSYDNSAFLFKIGGLTINVFLIIGIVLLIAAYVVLYKTRFGLRLQACGEHPQAADSVGINVYKMRWSGVLISGFLAGIGGFAYIVPAVQTWNFEVGVAGMPAATNTAIISYEYGGDVELASSGVFLTTLLAVVSIPALMSSRGKIASALRTDAFSGVTPHFAAASHVLPSSSAPICAKIFPADSGMNGVSSAAQMRMDSSRLYRTDARRGRLASSLASAHGAVSSIYLLARWMHRKISSSAFWNWYFSICAS